ncbi:S-protein homolog 2-like [Punica granatum]|uniref:S-protein homolog n=2 Tax=Punica granatum TaxID=22663 RepID=A0A218WJT8_PUNGR|nr:S-protein homolog 2-like [Punica granatum]OWM72833.1 hypothetical protein CDL15_Pgr021139 [Punica granatum]PKI34680.1 hypothetical protein CRG98_044940 [Punica granatum]
MRYVIPLFFMMLLALAMKKGVSQDVPTTTVMLTDELEAERVDVTVHCWSPDEDFGSEKLQKHYDYIFKLQSDTKVVTCTFDWLWGLFTYDVYVPSRDRDRCTNHLCRYIITRRGLCLHNPITLLFDICEEWKELPPPKA